MKSKSCREKNERETSIDVKVYDLYNSISFKDVVDPWLLFCLKNYDSSETFHLYMYCTHEFKRIIGSQVKNENHCGLRAISRFLIAIILQNRIGLNLVHDGLFLTYNSQRKDTIEILLHSETGIVSSKIYIPYRRSEILNMPQRVIVKEKYVRFSKVLRKHIKIGKWNIIVRIDFVWNEDISRFVEFTQGNPKRNQNTPVEIRINGYNQTNGQSMISTFSWASVRRYLHNTDERVLENCSERQLAELICKHLVIEKNKSGSVSE